MTYLYKLARRLVGRGRRLAGLMVGFVARLREGTSHGLQSPTNNAGDNLPGSSVVEASPATAAHKGTIRPFRPSSTELVYFVILDFGCIIGTAIPKINQVDPSLPALNVLVWAMILGTFLAIASFMWVSGWLKRKQVSGLAHLSAPFTAGLMIGLAGLNGVIALGKLLGIPLL